MRRYWYVLLLLAVVALVMLMTEPTGRTGHDAPVRAPGLLPGESLRPVETKDWPIDRRELPLEAVLEGRVFDPNGRPVRKAEVMVVFPRSYELVFTADDGSYRLPFAKEGKYLVEARLTIDLAAKREIVEIPFEGEAPRVDFHLLPAGHVFGEVVLEDAPLLHGAVDIGVLRPDRPVEWDLDTDCDNGFFNFFFEPPRHAPLRLVVRSTLGFMERPIEFRFAGEPLDLGRITLKRYPTLLLRMRLPDGTWAEEVSAGLAADLAPAGEDVEGWAGLPEELLASDSRLILAQKESATERFVFWDESGRHRVVRTVELRVDQLQELELHVRPGPIHLRRRLVDGAGRPVRARFAVPRGPETESGADGYFDLRVPHGGLHTVRLIEWHDETLGWIHLPRIEDAPRPAFLVDGDDPADCVLDLNGHVLIVAIAPGALRVLGDPSTDTLPQRWRLDSTGLVAGLFGAVQRLGPGNYRWTHLRRARDGGWSDPPAGDGIAFTVPERSGLTVVDAR